MTKIEWTNESWNPTIGCSRKACMFLYCYACKMATRLKHMGHKDYQLDNPFEPRFLEHRLNIPFKWRKARMVFVDSMGDLFDEHIREIDILRILEVIKKNPSHTFQVLTKQAQRAFDILDGLTLPKNLWLGTTQDGMTTLLKDINLISRLDLEVHFASFEPLLGSISTWPFNTLDWVIVGAQTNPTRQPKKEWVQQIINTARIQNIPIFLKDNLEGFPKIQEWPKR